MHEPFVPQSMFLDARPSVNSKHSDRYHSELSKAQGVTAELYEVIPADLHKDINSSPAFRTLVSGEFFSEDCHYTNLTSGVSKAVE